MADNSKRIMITGHRTRDFTLDQIKYAQESLQKVIKGLLKSNPDAIFVSGGATGTDTWWSLLAQKFERPLELYLAFPNQDSQWSNKEKALHRHIKNYASEITYASDEYSKSAYHIRNDSMLKVADIVVAVYDSNKNKSGTHSVVQKARKMGKPLIIIDFINEEIIKEKNG